MLFCQKANARQKIFSTLHYCNHMDRSEELEKLKREVARLQKENAALKQSLDFGAIKKTVIVPEAFRAIFESAEVNVHNYFSNIDNRPENGEILINGERYVLFRAAAISYEFLDVFKEFY